MSSGRITLENSLQGRKTTWHEEAPHHRLYNEQTKTDRLWFQGLLPAVVQPPRSEPVVLQRANPVVEKTWQTPNLVPEVRLILELKADRRAVLACEERKAANAVTVRVRLVLHNKTSIETVAVRRYSIDSLKGNRIIYSPFRSRYEKQITVRQFVLLPH